MRQFDRAVRRHHLARVKRREFNKRWSGWVYASDRSEESRQWAWTYARAAARTPTQCSCSMCGNPRKHYGNSIKGRTRQEERALCYLREQD